MSHSISAWRDQKAYQEQDQQPYPSPDRIALLERSAGYFDTPYLYRALGTDTYEWRNSTSGQNRGQRYSYSRLVEAKQFLLRLRRNSRNTTDVTDEITFLDAVITRLLSNQANSCYIHFS